MRVILIAATAILLSGCADVSSVPWRDDATAAQAGAGVTYSLPRGFVPLRVFADAKGIGLSVEPAYNAADPEAGFLIARLKPSILNRETMSLATDENGLLSLVSSDSEAKILEIAGEVAKTVGRLTFQSGKSTVLAETVTVFQRDLDPLSRKSIRDMNDGIRAGIERAAGAYAIANTRWVAGKTPNVVVKVDPSPPEVEPEIDLNKCQAGICVRVLTTRTITVSIDGADVASKVVNVPSWQVVPISVPQSVLSDQKITVSVKDGMLARYDLVRDAEALGLVKIPGAILGGLVAGVTQGLNDRKSTIDARNNLLTSEEAYYKALQAAHDRAQGKPISGTVPPVPTNQNGTPAPAGGAPVATPPTPPPRAETPSPPASTGDARTYRAATLTIYLYSTALADAIKALPKR